MASVAGPRPACGVHRSGSVVRGPGCPARPVSGPSGGCPVAWVHRPWSGVRPAGVHPSGVQPSGPHQAVAFGDRPMRQGSPHHGNGPRSLWAAALSSGSGRRPSRPGRGRRRRGHAWSAGLSVADPGQAGVRSARRRRRREGTGEAAARGCRPRDGWATTVRGRRRACRPGGRPRRGQGRCRRGWACGPSAAQAGSERARPTAGSALTCDDGWWACQDLNLGPHPLISNLQVSPGIPAGTPRRRENRAGCPPTPALLGP